MKGKIKYLILIGLFVSLSSMALHKFYIAIYQINYASQKKMLQITTRIFVDDLNDALEFKYRKKANLGTDKESGEDEVMLKNYLTDKFKLKINGQQKSFNYLSKELENNVLICYLSIKDVSKINTLEIENSILIEMHSEQQNIIQANINGEKQNLLLTDEKTKGLLKW